MFSKSVGPFTRQTFFSWTGFPPGRVDVASIHRTRPSCSYWMNVGRIGAMSLATSMGGFVVVMTIAGTPFLSPSATKFRIATSFPTNAGPTKRTFELNGIPPYRRSSRREFPVLTFSARFSTATASSAVSVTPVATWAFTATSRISSSFSFWYWRRLNSSSRSRRRRSHSSSWASRSRSRIPGVAAAARASRWLCSSSISRRDSSLSRASISFAFSRSPRFSSFRRLISAWRFACMEASFFSRSSRVACCRRRSCAFDPAAASFIFVSLSNSEYRRACSSSFVWASRTDPVWRSTSSERSSRAASLSETDFSRETISASRSSKIFLCSWNRRSIRVAFS